MSTSDTTITASAVVAGLHHWPSAPDRRAYLRHPHRHRFHATARVAVAHDDRDVEYHDLGEQVEVLLAGLGSRWHPESTLIDFGPQSCETLARALAALLADRGLRVVEVTVSEDGEHAATVIA